MTKRLLWMEIIQFRQFRLRFYTQVIPSVYGSNCFYMFLPLGRMNHRQPSLWSCLETTMPQMIKTKGLPQGFTPPICSELPIPNNLMWKAQSDWTYFFFSFFPLLCWARVKFMCLNTITIHNIQWPSKSMQIHPKTYRVSSRILFSPSENMQLLIHDALAI